MRDARALFALSTAILALHAVTDSFVAPERGTAWSDHLGRGLASLAVLALALLLYARLPAGGRAALALVLGALALEGAALAVADARAGGARGEDWTGFLLAPVGIVLCVLAAVLLWRSRKPGRLRSLRRIGVGLGAVLASYWLVVPVATAIVATHRPRADVAAVTLGRPYRTITLRTADGLDLAAWYVPSRNGAAVVSFPTRTGKVAQARMLVRHGYGVLLLDMRGYDGSAGDPNMFGWGAAKDIDAAVAWLQRRPDVDRGRIGGIGFSVGGELMLEAAAGNPGLRAVVSEGAGERSVRESLLHGARGWLALPEAAVRTTALAIMSGTAPPPALDDAVARIAPRAVFLIHAARGAGGEELNRVFLRAAGEPKSIWQAPGGHTGAFAASPREYERRVIAFFDRTLLGPGALREVGGSTPPGST
jgi:hypothetical protein